MQNCLELSNPEAQSYQIWSTVLGSSLTTLAPNGDKRETQVFAGGAVIAKQSFGTVEWRTADPVTGTVGRFSAAGSEFVFIKEEIEPLGQWLHLDDPSDPPEPYPAESRIGSADDPHWQCEISKQFWGGFAGMPNHCQNKILQAAGEKLPWEREKPESPRRITEPVDSPLPNLTPPFSPSDQVLVYALKSSAKNDDIKNYPMECCDDEGKPYPVPTAKGGLDMTVISGFVGADVGAKRKLSSEETERLRIGVNRLIEDKDCSDFLRKLLRTASEINPNALRYSDNIEYFVDSGIERLFIEIRDAQRGFFVNSGIGYHTVHGSLILGTIEILFAGSPDKIKSLIYPSGAKASERTLNAINKAREESFWRFAPSTAIHEILHAAGFGDVLLAEALAKIKGDDIRHITNMERGFDQNWAASKYWSEEMQKHCGGR